MQTILSSIVTVLVTATIFLPLIVFVFRLIFWIGTVPWSVKTGVPAGKQIGIIGTIISKFVKSNTNVLPLILL